MHSRPDQQDKQRPRQALPRRAPLPSRQQHAAAVPASVLAASQERLAPAGEISVPDRPGRDELPGPGAARLREYLTAVRLRAEEASSWLETSSHYARLVNRDGVVPVTARFTVRDLAFLGEAREEVLGLADLGLRLIDLHQPLDGGGGGVPPAPAQRCRSCMWRWPCPTFRILAEVLDGLRTG